jgi:phage-related protein
VRYAIEALTGVNSKVNITTAEVLIRGQWTILAIVQNGSCFTREYLGGLTEVDRRRAFSLLQFTAELGPRKNREKFNSLGDGLFEFKSYQDRLAWFYDGVSRIVITHGWKKKRDKAPKSEIDRARRLRAEYQESRT